MNFIERVKHFFGYGRQPNQVQTKGWWTNVSGSTTLGSYDYFGGQREPTKADLVRAFDDLVYINVKLIANNISYIPIRLYVKTATGQTCPKSATAKAREHVRKKYYNLDVREVVEHPLLDLINVCNPYHNRTDLIENTSTFLDLTGDSFWLINFNKAGIPEQLYLLPSDKIRPERDDNNFVREWILNQGTEERRYCLNEILHFKYANPEDCYGLGKSPLRAIWGRRQISTKEMSYLDNYLSNQGRPDAVISVKDSLNWAESERLAKEYFHRHQGQGSGGLLVLDGTMNFQPINFPAKDLEGLDVYSVLKTTICNAFNVPPDIWELGVSSNRSTKEAAIYSLARDCLTPRIKNIVEELNTRLVPYFDKRLFFEADPIVEEDKEHQLQVDQMLLTTGAMLRDEARMKYGLPSEEWAREPLISSGLMPAEAFGVQQLPTEPVETKPDRAAQAAQVQQVQVAVSTSQLSREAALANLQLLFGFSPAEAEALVPEVAENPHQITQDSGSAPETTEDTSEAPATPEQAPAAASNDLRATVGGSVAVADLQRSYYRRELPREAAIANAVLIFGFTDEEAGRLFPILPPNAPQQQAGQQDQQLPQQPAEQQAEQAKGQVRNKAMRQLAPGPLIKALQTFFGKLAKEVAGKVKSFEDAETKSVAVVNWFDMDAWTDSMFNDVRPVLAAYYDHGAKETLATLNLTPSMFETVQPKLKEGVDQAAMVFCEETLKTTNLELTQAQDSLKKEIAEGLVEGDVKNAMMRRVQKVFQEAETERAFRIGVTEASRGQHNAVIITAKESGVVSGKTWLLSDDACPICKPLNGKTVGLDDNFATDGTGPYSDIKAPPRHPSCRCTLLLKVD